MRLKFKGFFNGDFSQMPYREEPNSVQLKETLSNRNPKIVTLFKVLFVLVIILFYYFVRIKGNYRNGVLEVNLFDYLPTIVVCCLPLIVILISLFLHELLHAVCFKKDVELYIDKKKGNAFVFGSELMSRNRFILCALLPNIILGFIPLLIGFIMPCNVVFLYGVIFSEVGARDYCSAYNAITQVPSNALIYMSQEKTYWMIPSKR